MARRKGNVKDAGWNKSDLIDWWQFQRFWADKRSSSSCAIVFSPLSLMWRSLKRFFLPQCQLSEASHEQCLLSSSPAEIMCLHTSQGVEFFLALKVIYWCLHLYSNPACENKQPAPANQFRLLLAFTINNCCANCSHALWSTTQNYDRLLFSFCNSYNEGGRREAVLRSAELHLYKWLSVNGSHNPGYIDMAVILDVT